MAESLSAGSSRQSRWNLTGRTVRLARDLRWTGIPVALGAVLLGAAWFQASGTTRAAQAPEPVPVAPDAPAEEKYKLNMTNVAYFFFTSKGDVHVFFPGNPTLVLRGVDVEPIRRYMREGSPFFMVPQKVGRYYVNTSKVAYHVATKDGGATVYFVNCPSIDLTAAEVTQLNTLFSAPMPVPVAPAPEVAPPAPPEAPPAPAPAPPGLPAPAIPARFRQPPPVPSAPAPPPAPAVPAPPAPPAAALN